MVLGVGAFSYERGTPVMSRDQQAVSQWQTKRVPRGSPVGWRLLWGDGGCRPDFGSREGDPANEEKEEHDVGQRHGDVHLRESAWEWVGERE